MAGIRHLYCDIVYHSPIFGDPPVIELVDLEQHFFYICMYTYFLLFSTQASGIAIK